MEREIDLKDVSDGRFYDLNDMVKAGCNDCKGCSACCQGMGESIVLDPLDIYRLKSNLRQSFEGLLSDKLKLQVVDGIILPNLSMSGENEQCAFLNEQGRCSIHVFRPGICRIFPLGRFYEENKFRYFLQVKECPHPNKTKVKVQKWIDTPDTKRNQKFISDWHYFLKGLQNRIRDQIIDGTGDDQKVKEVSLYILENFYIRDFNEDEDFYEAFYQRLEEARCIPFLS